jgi:hypothetical protein
VMQQPSEPIFIGLKAAQHGSSAAAQAFAGAAFARPGLASAEESILPTVMQIGPSTLPASHMHASPASAAASPELALLTGQMSDFVLTQAPHLAFDILKELEDISSWEQLAVLLGGYEWMLRDVASSPTHLSDVRQALKRHL